MQYVILSACEKIENIINIINIDFIEKIDVFDFFEKIMIFSNTGSAQWHFQGTE